MTTPARTVAMLAGALWLGTALLLTTGSSSALMVALGPVQGNAGALASAAVPEHPGTGSAVLGGTGTTAPLAVAMTSGAVVPILGLLPVAGAPQTKGP